MKARGINAIKDIAITVVGWALIVCGVAALVLPGPGLLLLFAGVAVLATRYEWAERRLEPIKNAALKAAADSVSSWMRLTISVFGVAVLTGIGIFWGVKPPIPSWWPLPDSFWLPGGWGTGATLIASAVLAAFLIVVSWITFRKRPS
jgi:uncharacterized protein (TIGR02611 family)